MVRSSLRNSFKDFSFKNFWGYTFLVLFICFTFVSFDFSLYSFILAALFVIAVALLFCKARIWKFPLMLFLVSFIIRLGIIKFIPTPPQSDFAVLFDASQALLEGNKSFLDTSYFQLWTYQMGQVFYQSLFLRIYNDIFILKLMNCLYASGTIVLIYYFAREIAGEKAGKIASVICSFMPFSLFYVTVISNQFPASFLICFSLYILVAKRIKNKYVKFVLVGCLLALANVLRPESIIPLISIILYLLLTSRKETILKNLIYGAVLGVAYFATNSLINFLFVITELSPEGLSNNAPWWKFVLGFNHDSKGGYSDADILYLENRIAAIDVIKERLSVDFRELMELFSDKIKIFWGKSPLQWTFSFCMESGLEILGKTFRVWDDIEILEEISKCLNFFMYLLTIYGVGKAIRRKCLPNTALLFMNQVFVTMGVYLLIEVQPRYAYHAQICVAVLSALGISYVLEKLENAKRRRDLL